MMDDDDVDDDDANNDDGNGDTLDDKFVEMSMCLEITVRHTEVKKKQSNSLRQFRTHRTKHTEWCLDRQHTKHQTYK